MPFIDRQNDDSQFLRFRLSNAQEKGNELLKLVKEESDSLVSSALKVYLFTWMASQGEFLESEKATTTEIISSVLISGENRFTPISDAEK